MRGPGAGFRILQYESVGGRKYDGGWQSRKGSDEWETNERLIMYLHRCARRDHETKRTSSGSRTLSRGGWGHRGREEECSLQPRRWRVEGRRYLLKGPKGPSLFPLLCSPQPKEAICDEVRKRGRAKGNYATDGKAVGSRPPLTLGRSR